MTVPSFVSKSCRYMDGGPMPQGAPAPQGPPPDAGAPPQGGGQDPGVQLHAATQYAQSKAPQLAVQIADMVVEVMGLGASAPAGGPMAGGGAPMGDPGVDGDGAPMDGPPQINKKGGQMPSFGKKMAPGAKPAFGAPAVPGKGNPFGNKNAAPFTKGDAPKGKPMSADQKMKAKKDAQKKAGFGKK